MCENSAMNLLIIKNATTLCVHETSDSNLQSFKCRLDLG